MKMVLLDLLAIKEKGKKYRYRYKQAFDCIDTYISLILCCNYIPTPALRFVTNHHLLTSHAPKTRLSHHASWPEIWPSFQEEHPHRLNLWNLEQRFSLLSFYRVSIRLTLRLLVNVRLHYWNATLTLKILIDPQVFITSSTQYTRVKRMEIKFTKHFSPFTNYL